MSKADGDQMSEGVRGATKDPPPATRPAAQASTSCIARLLVFIAALNSTRDAALWSALNLNT
jgi:hypothetical protein